MNTAPNAFFLFLVLILGGCSQSPKDHPKEVGRQLSSPTKKDFLDHLELLGLDFIQGHRQKLISLGPPSQKYLQSIIQRIGVHNELFFGNLKKTEIFIIRDERPYHFSVPKRKIFISLGLLQKYISHEALLASVLAIEMIRAHKNIFTKNLLVPTGDVSLKTLHKFLKIDLKLRLEINKWASYIIQKSGHDPLSLLGLLQLKNRNFLDFYENNEEGREVSIEEAQIKQFLIQYKLFNDIEKFAKNSSPGFYHFIDEVRKI